MQTISPQELKQKMDAGASIVLIDVRTPAEFREVHASPAKNIPLDRLSPEQLNGQEEVFVICKSGSRGRMACEKLLAQGLSATNVSGGTEAWDAAGLPVVRGQKTMSLERQVRIAAGSLIVLGVILSVAVHPWFVGLCGFIGAGLVFAGVTDTCGMGMMIAKLPWNQVPVELKTKPADQSCAA